MTVLAQTSNTIDGIADAILARLQAELPHVRCDHFPDNPSRSPLLAHPDYALVHFKGATSPEPSSMNPQHQMETSEWWVVLTTRSLRGPTGMANRIEEVRAALRAWRPPQGGTPFQSRAIEFVDEADGLWRYRLRFAHTLPRVAAATVLTGPTLVGATIESAP
jgi:hypothetical protein